MDKPHFLGQLLEIYGLVDSADSVASDLTVTHELMSLMALYRDSLDFKLFMEEVRSHHDAWMDTDTSWLTAVTDKLPCLMEIDEALRQNTMKPAVIVYYEQVEIAQMFFNTGLGLQSVAGLLPGIYHLELDIGGVIYQEHLGKEDLIWSYAFPGRSLDLAADSGDVKRLASKKRSLFDGRVAVRIYPGIETGCLEVELK